MPAETFGQRLREARERRGLSVDDVASATGLHMSYIKLLEDVPSGADGCWCPVAYLPRLCNALDISADELLGRNRSEVDRGR